MNVGARAAEPDQENAESLPVSAIPVLKLLHEVFGHTTLRPGQALCVTRALESRDTLAVLPTGGGKSLCYQLPALHLARTNHKTSLVISPLIALMQDQVEALRAHGIRAAALHSQLDYLEQRRVSAEFVTGKLDLLYLSPERATTEGFRRLMHNSRECIGILAIDEAHCISRWGHDFRPEYRRLAELRTLLGDPPTIALTATATATVRQDIVRSLGLQNAEIIMGSFRRHNLEFKVFPLKRQQERLEQLKATLKAQEPGRSIVYCSSRKLVDKVASWLRVNGFRNRVAHYHAGRTNNARMAAHDRYHQGTQPIMVATNAFGMGIDHPNVRTVVHFQTPGSLEAYYQEAGRAGRDGEPAQCLLFFGIQDLVLQNRLIPTAHHHLIEGIESYARGSACRQAHLERYFVGSELSHNCGLCDQCKGEAKTLPTTHASGDPNALDEHALNTIIQCVGALRRPVGKTNLAKGLRGSQAKTLKRTGLLTNPEHGALKHHTIEDLIAAIGALLDTGRLVRRGQKYPTLWLPNKPIRTTSHKTKKESTQRPRGSTLRRALQNYRKRKARSLKWKAYMVFQKQVIDAIEVHRPKTLWELEQMPGLGPAKIERFGDDLLLLIRENA